MDIYCPTCHEPWDNDSLHDEVEARKARKASNEEFYRSHGGTGDPPVFTLGLTYDEVAADFRKRGCKALVCAFGPTFPECVRPSEPDAMRSAAIEAAFEICGDDMDGAASMLDDLGIF